MARTSEGRVQGQAWCLGRDREQGNTDALSTEKYQKDTRTQRPSTRASAAKCRHTDIQFTIEGVPYCPICRQNDRDQIRAMFPKVRGDE